MGGSFCVKIISGSLPMPVFDYLQPISSGSWLHVTRMIDQEGDNTYGDQRENRQQTIVFAEWQAASQATKHTWTITLIGAALAFVVYTIGSVRRDFIDISGVVGWLLAIIVVAGGVWLERELVQNYKQRIRKMVDSYITYGR